MSEETRARKVLQVLNQLESRYGVQESPSSYTPLETFLLAILMNYVSRSRAFEALQHIKRRFVDWNEARVSTGKEIAELCSPVKVPEAAGCTIQHVLDKIYADCSVLSLDTVKGKSGKEIREYLAKFDSIPAAAIAYTMLYGFQKAAAPLTPPVLRVAERLGLVDLKCGPVRAERQIDRILPSARMASFFELLSLHAEEVCRERDPKCRACVTARRCIARQVVVARRKVLPRRLRRTTMRALVSARHVRSARPKHARRPRKRARK